MFYVYILQSIKFGKYYIGSTSDLNKRVEKHNNGGSIWTKAYRPWNLVYFEEFSTKIESMKREKEIKAYKGGNSFKKLVSNTSR